MYVALAVSLPEEASLCSSSSDSLRIGGCGSSGSETSAPVRAVDHDSFLSTWDCPWELRALTLLYIMKMTQIY